MFGYLHWIPGGGGVWVPTLDTRWRGSDTAPLVLKNLWPQEREILLSTRGILECIRKSEVDRISYVSSRW